MLQTLHGLWGFMQGLFLSFEVSMLFRTIQKAVDSLQAFGKWIDNNAVMIIWCLISLICASLAVSFYIIAGEFINTFNVFFE